MEDSGKPANVIDKIVEGKLGSFYSQVVLPDQPSIRDPKMTVADVIAAATRTLGGQVTVTRFARLKVGEAAALVLSACSARARERSPCAPAHRRPVADFGDATLANRSRAIIGSRDVALETCIQTNSPETLRRSAHGLADLRHRSGRGDPDRKRRRRNSGHGCRDRHRHRRREHLPWRRGERARDGSGDSRLHGHARDGHQRPGLAGRARTAERGHARGHGD